MEKKEIKSNIPDNVEGSPKDKTEEEGDEDGQATYDMYVRPPEAVPENRGLRLVLRDSEDTPIWTVFA